MAYIYGPKAGYLRNHDIIKSKESHKYLNPYTYGSRH